MLEIKVPFTGRSLPLNPVKLAQNFMKNISGTAAGAWSLYNSFGDAKADFPVNSLYPDHRKLNNNYADLPKETNSFKPVEFDFPGKNSYCGGVRATLFSDGGKIFSKYMCIIEGTEHDDKRDAAVTAKYPRFSCFMDGEGNYYLKLVLSSIFGGEFEKNCIAPQGYYDSKEKATTKSTTALPVTEAMTTAAKWFTSYLPDQNTMSNAVKNYVSDPLMDYLGVNNSTTHMTTYGPAGQYNTTSIDNATMSNALDPNNQAQKVSIIDSATSEVLGYLLLAAGVGIVGIAAGTAVAYFVNNCKQNHTAELDHKETEEEMGLTDNNNYDGRNEEVVSFLGGSTPSFEEI